MGMLIGDLDGNWHDLTGPFALPANDIMPPLVQERREKFSFAFGDLELVQIILPELYIVYGDMLLQQQHFNMRAVNIPDTIEMHFSLKGNGWLNNNATGKQYHFGANRHNLMYVPALDGKACYMDKEMYQFFEVHLDRKYFLELVRDTNPVLYDFAEKVEGKMEVHANDNGEEITFAMYRCIRDIMDCRFAGGLKFLYLQSKCIELLTLQVASFEKQARAKSALTSAYDKDCIMYAKEYLLQHITAPPTLTELAAIAGTNTFKLKNGFKELFNNTVFGYLSDTRLEKAQGLLLAGMPVKEVADRLGYSSVQHFSTAFRKKFSVPPGKLRR
ncbi:AraC family transcriptional regulator [Chitinophaga sp. OAE865]|uniref:helix-turn-helix transcriptional regulator n=1 Tax=Chitinophaga sp. OAE865 TaxID=2817898 RepID=UPI001AE56DBA